MNMLECLKTLPEELSPFLIKKSFNKGESILLCGDSNQMIYWLAEGTAFAYTESPDGHIISAEYYKAGDMFGEIEVFLEGTETINIKAMSTCNLYMLH